MISISLLNITNLGKNPETTMLNPSSGAQISKSEIIIKRIKSSMNSSIYYTANKKYINEYMLGIKKLDIPDCYIINDDTDNSLMLFDFSYKNEISILAKRDKDVVDKIIVTPSSHLYVDICDSLSKATLLEQWSVWEHASEPGERRQEAIRRLKECLIQNQTTLDLSELSLTSLPEHRPASVHTLILSNNRLVKLPTQILEGLRVLVVNNNLLESFPSLEFPPAQIDINNNPITDFKKSLSLLQQIEAWLPVAKGTEVHNHWSEFTEEEYSDEFAKFLEMLNQSIVIRSMPFRNMVIDLLNDLSDDRDLRKICFSIASEACASCSDRALLGWNNMQLARTLHQESIRKETILPEKFLAIARQFFRIQKLEEIFWEKIHKQKSAHIPDYDVDEVEVYLALLTQLQRSLELPERFAPKMNYPRQSGLTCGDMSEVIVTVMTAESTQLLNWLSNWKPCQEYLIRHLSEPEKELLMDQRIAKFNECYEVIIEEKKEFGESQELKIRIGEMANIKANYLIFSPLIKSVFDGYLPLYE